MHIYTIVVNNKLEVFMKMSKHKFIFLFGCFSIFIFADGHTMNPERESHHLISKQDCKEMKNGIGTFLYGADLLFNEAEELKKKTGSENEEYWEKMEGATWLSGLAANYSTIYDVWCKKSQMKRKHKKNKDKNKK
tara:strand:- start:2396 stop:2800 length:405 start_codon:yes stop_codon:yes gene_type:complete